MVRTKALGNDREVVIKSHKETPLPDHDHQPSNAFRQCGTKTPENHIEFPPPQ
jgi:hypothetical protein